MGLRQVEKCLGAFFRVGRQPEITWEVTNAWQEPWAFGQEAQDLRGFEEEGDEQVPRGAHQQRAGKKEPLVFSLPRLPGKVDLSRERPVRMGGHTLAQPPERSAPVKERPVRTGETPFTRPGKEFPLPPNQEN